MWSCNEYSDYTVIKFFFLFQIPVTMNNRFSYYSLRFTQVNQLNETPHYIVSFYHQIFKYYQDRLWLLTDESTNDDVIREYDEWAKAYDEVIKCKWYSHIWAI